MQERLEQLGLCQSRKDVSPVNQTPKGLRLNNESLPHVEVVEIVLSEQAQLLLAGSFACIGVPPAQQLLVHFCAIDNRLA